MIRLNISFSYDYISKFSNQNKFQFQFSSQDLKTVNKSIIAQEKVSFKNSFAKIHVHCFKGKKQRQGIDSNKGQ